MTNEPHSSLYFLQAMPSFHTNRKLESVSKVCRMHLTGGHGMLPEWCPRQDSGCWSWGLGPSLTALPLSPNRDPPSENPKVYQ